MRIYLITLTNNDFGWSGFCRLNPTRPSIVKSNKREISVGCREWRGAEKKKWKGEKREKKKCTHGDMEEVMLTTVTLGDKLTFMLLELIYFIFHIFF